MVNDTKEVHSIGLKNDEFIFSLVDKRLKATRYSKKLTISGRIKGLTIRKVLMCDS